MHNIQKSYHDHITLWMIFNMSVRLCLQFLRFIRKTTYQIGNDKVRF